MAIKRIRREYYAIRNGNAVTIRKSAQKPKRVTSTLRIPKLPDSPRYTDTGYNEGTTLQQVCYNGGLLVGACSYREFRNTVGVQLYESNCQKLEGEARQSVIRLLESYQGED